MIFENLSNGPKFISSLVTYQVLFIQSVYSNHSFPEICISFKNYWRTARIVLWNLLRFKKGKGQGGYLSVIVQCLNMPIGGTQVPMTNPTHNRYLQFCIHKNNSRYCFTTVMAVYLYPCSRTHHHFLLPFSWILYIDSKILTHTHTHTRNYFNSSLALMMQVTPNNIKLAIYLGRH